MDPRHLPPDFREFLACLNAAGVEYLLIGGHAVAFHGYPRVTSDMDVWINRTPANAETVLAAIRAFFGTNMAGLTASQLLDPELVTHFGARPHLIEVLNKISGGDFAQAWPRRISTDYDGVQVQMISLTDLKQNKLASARAKDLADLENLPR
jgi:predicted nucleotidyltransferase